MSKLTVVFEYPDDASMVEAQRLFKNGGAGTNVVHVVPYDAVEVARKFDSDENNADAQEGVAK